MEADIIKIYLKYISSLRNRSFHSAYLIRVSRRLKSSWHVENDVLKVVVQLYNLRLKTSWVTQEYGGWMMNHLGYDEAQCTNLNRCLFKFIIAYIFVDRKMMLGLHEVMIALQVHFLVLLKLVPRVKNNRCFDIKVLCHDLHRQKCNKVCKNSELNYIVHVLSPGIIWTHKQFGTIESIRLS